MESRGPIKYSGQGFSPKGEKDRLVLPPQFRATVRESSNNSRILCLVRHNRWPCLTGFGLSHFDALTALIDHEEAGKLQRGEPYDREMRENQLFSFSQVPFDDSGRFVLPSHLKLDGDPAEGRFFQGAGPVFTVWAPSALAAMGPGWEGAQNGCASLVADAKAKA